jgi:hypothetical protein
MKALNILVLIFLVSYSLYAQNMKEDASPDIHVKKDLLVNPQKNEIELVVGGGISFEL